MNQYVDNCRWCGCHLTAGYKYCPICHRSQGRIHGIIGPTANWIAVAAVIVTGVQLYISIQQNNSAISNTQNSEEVLRKIEDERSELEKLKGKMFQVEKSTQDTSHASTQALLKIQEIEARVSDLNAERIAEIETRRSAVDDARAKYAMLEGQLKEIPPTKLKDVPAKSTEKQCVSGPFASKICFPVEKTTVVKRERTNPDYVTLKLQVENASKELKRAEDELSKALTK